MDTGEEVPISKRLRSWTALRSLVTDSEEDIVEYGENNGKKHPLKIGLIVDYVFGFLDLDDIKNCRRVCSLWNDISVPYVEKKSCVLLGYPEKGLVFEERSVRTFNLLAENSAITFKAFKLVSLEFQSAKWPTATLVQFFESQRQTMKELTVGSIIIESSINERYFSLSPHIGNDLSHLAVQKFCAIVSTSNATSASSISFKYCQVDIAQDVMLAPIKFELRRAKIKKEGRSVKTCLVNEILKFENLEDLTLDGYETELLPRNYWRFDTPCYRRIDPSLSLNMLGDVSLKNLSLESVAVPNMKECQWKISEKLKLRSIPFTFDKRTEMQFTDMDFANSTINLNSLPESIEKLTLSQLEGKGTEITSLARRSSLPNLKHLELYAYRNFSRTEQEDEDYNILSIFSVFKNCENLKTIKFKRLEGRKRGRCCGYSSPHEIQEKLRTQWIPRTTENLYLDGNIRVIGKAVNLKKLVIQINHLHDLIGLLAKLKCDHLILNLWSKSMKKFSQLEEDILTIIKMPYKTVAIGPLKISARGFNKSEFSKYVDKRAEFYLFIGPNGKAIEEEEFEEMIKNNAHTNN